MVEPVLVADIGGTNARFALADAVSGSIAIRDMRSFRAEDFETVRDAATAYLGSVSETPRRGCFAAAGPVIDDAVDFTNSHWRLSAADIAGALALEQFRIVNDFFALAAGVAYMPDDAVIEIKSGTPVPDAPQLVIGPGTGLGQALIVPTGTGHKVIATEGGHVAFAARTDEEFEIRKFIAREYPRVSVERLLSGQGLANIHRALCAIEGKQRLSLRPDEITEAAKNGTHPVAIKAVELFCSILGRVAGDAALSTGARGGVVLGGGILPKIQGVFKMSDFIERFTDKGRMTDYVRSVPVCLVVAEGAALYGAAAALEDFV